MTAYVIGFFWGMVLGGVCFWAGGSSRRRRDADLWLIDQQLRANLQQINARSRARVMTGRTPPV